MQWLRTLAGGASVFVAVFFIVLIGISIFGAIKIRELGGAIHYLDNVVVIRIRENGAFNTSITRAIREVQNQIAGNDEDAEEELQEAIVQAADHLHMLASIELDDSYNASLSEIYATLNQDRRRLLEDIRTYADG